jgi:hypothetical protein
MVREGMVELGEDEEGHGSLVGENAIVRVLIGGVSVDIFEIFPDRFLSIVLQGR